MNDFNKAPKDFATPQELSHDDIAHRAYAIYMSNGCPPGQCEQNWLQAETELRAMAAMPGTSPVAEALHDRASKSASKIEPSIPASTPKNSIGNTDAQKATTRGRGSTTKKRRSVK